jgi:hypothetical protein
MKRRSARPFTVEVKQTRASRASFADAKARSHKGPDLWRGLPLIADGEPAQMQPVQPAPAVRSEPAQPEAPARRVLPSLVSTFSMPSEPEAQEGHTVPAVQPLPRVRRPKQLLKRDQSPAPRVSRTPVAAMEPTLPARIAPVAAASASAAVPAVVARPASIQLRAAQRNQQEATLRPGQRWKRRLPRILW